MAGIHVTDDDLADLRDRIRRTRWPERETVDDWSQGVPLHYLRELCDYWASDYNWRRCETRLNALPQRRISVGSLDIHVVHVRSSNPTALPLVLTNGWPSSIVEYLDVIEPLARDFHVVIPALPGYGQSDKPTRPGWGVERIATAWLDLMDQLGYRRFGAQGSDWGASITTSLAQQAPERVVGIHLNPPIAAPDLSLGAPTPREEAALRDLDHAAQWESGYHSEQSTKPQTIGYALVDSPIALCAWIAEKFHTWTEVEIDRDRLLDNVSLYWFTATGASSARLYWESFRDVAARFATANTDTIDVPTACSIYPKEIPRPSRRWAAQRYTDIRQWHEHDRGGHFAALEQPQTYVDDLRSFFAALV